MIQKTRFQTTAKCKIYALLFEPLLLVGQYNGEIFQKYVAPVMNSGISGLEIPAAAPAFPHIREITPGQFRGRLQECFFKQTVTVNLIYGQAISPIASGFMSLKKFALSI